MARVFVTDANLHFSLPFVRTLGKQGLTVVAGEEHSAALSFLSRYSKESLVYPSIKDPGFASFIREHIERFDAIIPVSDEANEFFARHTEFSHKVAQPEYENYRIARDKSKTMKLAEKQGIPHPKSLYVTEEREPPFRFPLILKPTKALGMRGVCISKNKKEYWKNLRFLLKEYKSCLIQEFIPFGGHNYCADLLYDKDSNLKSLYMSKIHRTYPVYGGPDTFTETIEDERIKSLATRLLEPLEWKGIVNVEFKEHPETKELYLMEINPRPSSSISLAMSAGLDFPNKLYEIITKGTTEEQFEYKTQVFQRQLATDLLHFIRHPDKLALFKQKCSGKVHYTNMHWDDPLPLASHLINLCRLAAQPKFRKEHDHLLIRSTKVSDKTYQRLYNEFYKDQKGIPQG
ncbi:MAG: ATP-grasp domain-containing protein [Candidatus Woesearchaeota archaeon]